MRMESLGENASQESIHVPELTVRREDGLVLVSQLIQNGSWENISDEESLFMIGLIHGHPERENEVTEQLQKYKPHVEDQNKLKGDVLAKLSAAEVIPKTPEETGESQWKEDRETANDHIANLLQYFRVDTAQLGIKDITVVPSDDILPPQSGRSFKVRDEIIIMSRSGAWENFDHEFLHGIVNPAVEIAVSKLSGTDKKAIINLASENLKGEQGYGEHPESLLQETIIRTYVNFISSQRPKPDKVYMANLAKALTKAQFQKAMNESPTLKDQLSQTGIANLEDLRAKWGIYFDKFGRNELRERVYDFLKSYERSDESFADFLDNNLKSLVSAQKQQGKSHEYGQNLRKFTYRDNSKGGEVIFECVAENILDADKMYQGKTGNDPEKQSYVGCTIDKIRENDGRETNTDRTSPTVAGH